MAEIFAAGMLNKVQKTCEFVSERKGMSKNVKLQVMTLMLRDQKSQDHTNSLIRNTFDIYLYIFFNQDKTCVAYITALKSNLQKPV